MCTLVSPFNAEEFRRRLAEISSTNTDDYSSVEPYVIKLCILMAKHFGDELDRKTMWDRIASGLQIASAKNPLGGPRLINDAMEHIKALPAMVASDPDVATLMSDFSSSASISKLVSQYLNRSLYVAVVLGRNAWQDYKGAK